MDNLIQEEVVVVVDFIQERVARQVQADLEL
jgi:hypothetical protein